MAADTPPAPPESGLSPLIERWERDERVWRCHDGRLRADEFNPGMGEGRFHPILDRATGAPIPTLYGSDRVPGVLSESVFHNVPVRGPAKRIRRSTLTRFRLSALVPRRDLLLADLSGNGLKRLGLRRPELIESSSASYAATRAWAEAIHRDAPADGLVWVSRQHDRALAIMLFGDRVGASDLGVLVDSLALDHGLGWHYVLRSAEEADIAILL